MVQCTAYRWVALCRPDLGPVRGSRHCAADPPRDILPVTTGNTGSGDNRATRNQCGLCGYSVGRTEHLLLDQLD